MLAGARKNKTIDARLGKNCPGRNAGQEHAGTQGWRRSRQVARLPSAGGLLRSTVNSPPSSEKSTHPTASGPPRSSGD